MKYTPESAVALVTSGGDEFLTMRRLGYDEPLELPSTTLQPPESSSQAIVRHLKEDFDLEVASSQQIGRMDVRLSRALATVYIVRAAVDEEDLRYIKSIDYPDMRSLSLTQLRYGQRTGQYNLSPLLSRVKTIMDNGEIRLQEEAVAIEG